MLQFIGKYASMDVMIDEIEPELVQKIYKILNHPAFEDTHPVLMPDCHEGKGACIGFTSKVNNYVIPNVVGVDIGCGVLSINIGRVNVDRVKFDEFIKKNVPHGKAHRQEPYKRLHEFGLDENGFASALENTADVVDQSLRQVLNQIGTLGGGNHFVELERDPDNNIWLSIHTGSRNFGLRVANYHQRKAKELMKEIYTGSAYTELEYLKMLNDGGGKEYLADMMAAQKMAEMNRAVIADIILSGFFKAHFNDDIRENYSIECVHNYINFDDCILRKGAISAHHNERVLIPLNSRDGIIVGHGRENPDWNFSAPHGAGRILSRGEAKETLDVEVYQKQLADADIYTTTATLKTLDEAPDAYKNMYVIVEAIKPTVDIDFIMKPIYVFKSEE
jgi:RNA-splicing ligase RtcB